MADLKSRFNITFANLPIPMRDNVAVVVDDNPLSWNVLKIEVDNNTELSIKALNILDKLDFLKKI